MVGSRERSALDEAWSAWLAGRTEEAIRSCVALVEADPGQLSAASLLAEVLQSKSADVVRGAAERLVDAYVRRGDLPRAVAAIELVKRTDGDAEPLRRSIAVAFGKGSKRVKDVAPAPPPLPPKSPSIPKALSKLKGAALIDRAAKALGDFVAHPDELSSDAPLPRLPLFGTLPPDDLEQLLEAWEVREIRRGEAVIEEGTEGRDAFVVVRGLLRAERRRGDEAVVLAMLGPGALFGEMALVSDAPRAASVVAEEPVQLLAASRDALEALAKRTPKIGQQLSEFCRARMISNLMRHSDVLRAVAPADREALIARFDTRAFKAGERLVTLGEESDGLFLIASGSVRVLGRDADGEELQIAALGPGDVVGEISLVLRRPASANVVATHPTVALELRREGFQEAIKAHPTLLSELYDLATKREEEMRSVVAQEALDVEEVVLL